MSVFNSLCDFWRRCALCVVQAFSDVQQIWGDVDQIYTAAKEERFQQTAQSTPADGATWGRRRTRRPVHTYRCAGRVARFVPTLCSLIYDHLSTLPLALFEYLLKANLLNEFQYAYKGVVLLLSFSFLEPNFSDDKFRSLWYLRSSQIRNCLSHLYASFSTLIILIFTCEFIVCTHVEIQKMSWACQLSHLGRKWKWAFDASSEFNTFF